MSMSRVCPNCFQVEATRYNFDYDIKTEQEFQAEKWCACGYESPEEMMLDQDMPFQDPKWIPLTKHFLEDYHLRLRKGEIKDAGELIRFFLRLLKSSANGVSRSIVLVDMKEDESYAFVHDGKTNRKPKPNIFIGPSMMSISMALLSARITAANVKENSIPAKAKRNRRWAWGVLGFLIGLILGINLA